MARAAAWATLAVSIAALAPAAAGAASSRHPVAADAQPAAWTRLPPTPRLPEPAATGMVPVDGGAIFYARYGDAGGDPVILLHGGLASSDWWGLQIPALAARHAVVAVDARGHGRSTLPPGPITYAAMASDVAAVMDALSIRRAAVVGWSDGAIAALILAASEPARVTRLFAFGADAGGLIPNGAKNPVFAAYTARAAAEHARLSPRPQDWRLLVQAMDRMWAAGSPLTPALLAAIRAPTVVADGDHDEIVARSETSRLAASHPVRDGADDPGHEPLRDAAEPCRVQRGVARVPRLTSPRGPAMNAAEGGRSAVAVAHQARTVPLRPPLGLRCVTPVRRAPKEQPCGMTYARRSPRTFAGMARAWCASAL